MRHILTITLLGMLLGLEGCATVTKGTTDTIYVGISNCIKTMECTATNKKGYWQFTAPGSVTFLKSDDDLFITCDDDGEVISRMVTPERGGMIWGNAILGGLLGTGYDAYTDAHWNTSDGVSLHRVNCPKGMGK